MVAADRRLRAASTTHPSPARGGADAAHESAARIVAGPAMGFCSANLLARESNAPKWRDLLGILRRLEGARRGPRWTLLSSGFAGEQFALPEAVESLPLVAHPRVAGDDLRRPAADPMNLAGIVIPGEPRRQRFQAKEVRYRNGLLADDIASFEAESLGKPAAAEARKVRKAFVPPLPAACRAPGAYIVLSRR